MEEPDPFWPWEARDECFACVNLNIYYSLDRYQDQVFICCLEPSALSNEVNAIFHQVVEQNWYSSGMWITAQFLVRLLTNRRMSLAAHAAFSNCLDRLNAFKIFAHVESSDGPLVSEVYRHWILGLKHERDPAMEEWWRNTEWNRLVFSTERTLVCCL